MYKFKFADIGEGLSEGTVTEVHVKVGDVVKDGDDLFTVETEKITTEIASPIDGVIKEILLKAGQVIKVGEVVFIIDDGKKEEQSKESESGGASVVGEVKVSNNPLPDIFAPKTTNVVKKEVEVKKESMNQESKSFKIHQGVEVLTTPLARAVASELGVNINQVKGSGPEGRVLVKDVKKHKEQNLVSHVEKSSLKAVIPAAKSDGVKREERAPVTSLRKSIATVVKNSWNNVAYTSLSMEIDASKLWETRSKIKVYAKEKYGVNVTFLPYILKAFVVALKEYPLFNATLDEKRMEFVLKKYYNIGIAVDAPQGLVVPVVKNVDIKTILQLSDEIIKLGKKARAGKLTVEEMSGGTFTVTNFGSFRASFGVPVIKYPELAIAGIGTIFDRAQVVNEKLVNKKLMYITVAADHRWIDGADIGRFLWRAKELLETPEKLILY